MRNGMILVDLQKAFDTLFELFLKNEIIWFLESVNKWFESYFSNRKFLVYVDAFSEAGILKYRVRQGSILGSLLCLLYVNDLPQSLSDTDSCLHAGDTVFSTNMRKLRKLKIF